MGNVLQYYRALNRGGAPPVAAPFISTWRTTNTSGGSSASNQIRLPLINGGVYDFTVDWGDGSSDNITVWNQSETTKTYASPGDKTITITGQIDGWAFNATGDRLKILNVSQWGVFNHNGANGAFYNCSNLNVTATDVPDFKTSTSMYRFFRGCSSLTSSNINGFNVSLIQTFEECFAFANINIPLGAWNMSSATVLTGMFRNNSTFNQNISGWNVSSVTTFGSSVNGIFQNASAFNQNISSWVTTSATSMARMFSGATSFNQDISGWNVSSVLDFSFMFQAKNGYTFSLNSWNTSSANNMSGMFANSNYNQNIGSWNVSNVVNFSQMFQVNNSFNQNLNSWNVSKGTNFFAMFQSSVFNSDISSWSFSVISNINAQSMFDNNAVFNQNISGWDTQRFTNMAAMFRDASAFNQNIGGWNVGAVTVMSIGATTGMFTRATAFNQNIGSWNVSNVTNFIDFMLGKTNLNFSASNLDAIYNGWSSLPSLSSNEDISFGTIKYTAAGQTGRDLLTGAPNNWTITDGGI